MTVMPALPTVIPAKAEIHGEGASHFQLGAVDRSATRGTFRHHRLLSPGRLRSVLPEDEFFFIGTCNAGTFQATVLLVLSDGGLQGSEAQSRALGTGGDDLASQLHDHLVVVHL